MVNCELTVIVPIYNGEKTLKACLNSLLKVNIPIHIICLNDGSSDKSATFLAEYSKQYSFIEVVNKENSGIADARNCALEKVKTPYFTFLDCDDEVNPLIYKKMLLKAKEEDSDIVFSDFLWVYQNGMTKLAKEEQYQDIKTILVKMYATLWNKLYRTAWVKNTNLSFPSGLRYEDASFLYRLAIHMRKISYVSDISVYYKQQPQSLTHSYDLHVEDMIKVFTGIKEYYCTQGVYDKYFAEIEYLNIRFFLGNSYLRACRIKDKNLRSKTLEKSYQYLLSNYPRYKENKYLLSKGKKNLYFRYLNHFLYWHLPPLFRALFKLGILKS